MRAIVLVLACTLLGPPAVLAEEGTKTPVSETEKGNVPDELANFDKLWNYGQPAETEAKFRELLPAAEKLPDSGLKLELLTQIARCQGLQRKFDEAHATLDEVEKQLGEASPRAKVRYLLERGRAFNSSNQKDTARPLFLEAWEVGRKSGEDNLAVDAAHMLGIIEPPAAAIAWSEKAMQLAETSQDPQARRWLGPLYNNLGWTYHDDGDYERAMELFQKGVDFRREHGSPKTLHIAKWSVARCHRSLGHVEQALKMQQALLADLEKNNDSDGYVYEELGECYLLLKQPDKARPYFAQAYAELSKDEWLKEHEAERLKRLKELSVQ